MLVSRFPVTKRRKTSCLLQASCVLETGVKIYATRVDATHSEAYKVLGGLNRTSAEETDTGMGLEQTTEPCLKHCFVLVLLCEDHNTLQWYCALETRFYA